MRSKQIVKVIPDMENPRRGHAESLGSQLEDASTWFGESDDVGADNDIENDGVNYR